MAFIIKDWFKVATGFLKSIPTYLPSIDIFNIVNRQKEKAEEKQHSDNSVRTRFLKKTTSTQNQRNLLIYQGPIL